MQHASIAVILDTNNPAPPPLVSLVCAPCCLRPFSPCRAPPLRSRMPHASLPSAATRLLRSSLQLRTPPAVPISRESIRSDNRTVRRSEATTSITTSRSTRSASTHRPSSRDAAAHDAAAAPTAFLGSISVRTLQTLFSLVLDPFLFGSFV